MKQTIATLILAVFALQANAQSKSILKKWDYTFTNMAKSGMYSPSIDVKQYFSMSKKKSTKFQLGIGVRLTHASAGYCNRYLTAPANLTTGKTGPGVFFSDQIATNVDTFGLDKTRINSINTLIALNYRITSKLNAEFNIDLIGLSFGGKQNAYLRNQAGVDSTFVTATASPTSTNVLLISDNDLGTLNSEFVFSYKINNHVKVKLGMGFLFTEYTFTNPTYVNSNGIVVNNDRFRNKSLGTNFGVIYHF